MFRIDRLLAVALLAATFSVSAQAADRLTVVELFTSQGCNSCPPADKLMGELVKRENILGLSFHVDYWDYIGWHDTFALQESSVRQRNYVGRAGGRYAYTPQIVVGGKEQVVGSRRSAVENAISHDAARANVDVAVSPLGEGRFEVNLEPQEIAETAWIWLVTFDNHHEVDIRRGENAGRKLSYYNVVRKIERIAVWDGTQGLMVPVDMAEAWADGRDGCAIVVQAAGFGPILGAARLSNPGS